jgi:HEPN domain-containing protein
MVHLTYKLFLALYLAHLLADFVFHATELLLKSYLRAHGKEPWTHKLGKLLKEGSDLGLTQSA